MALLAPLRASTLPFDLTAEAVEQFPKTLGLARALQGDMASLEPVRTYLQHKHGLTEDLATGAISDYLKHLIMSLAIGEPIAPSEQGDLAWHSHILHTRLYGPWCIRHFGRFVHHIPSEPDHHPAEDFLKQQYQFGKLFYGDKTIYQSLSGHCSNSHDCIPGDHGPGGGGNGDAVFRSLIASAMSGKG